MSPRAQHGGQAVEAFFKAEPLRSSQTGPAPGYINLEFRPGLPVDRGAAASRAKKTKRLSVCQVNLQAFVGHLTMKTTPLAPFPGVLALPPG